MTRGRRIARNTAVQVVGEVASRGALIALYAVMARELGTRGLGEFTFALSLSLILLLPGGLGLDEVIARTIARDPREIGRVFWNGVTIKLALGGLGVLAAILVALLGDYSRSLRVAIVVLAFSALLEIVTPTLYAVFQGLNDLLPEAISLLAQRTLRAALGIAVVLGGGGVDGVALVYLLGAVSAAASIALTARRRRLALAREISATRMRVLASTALPIGVGAVFTVVLWRVDAVILGVLKDDSAVGVYGAAARLIEAPLFLSVAFVGAMLPVLSRLTPATAPSAAQAYEGGCAVLAAILTPIGASLVIFAEPVSRLLYGAQFTSAATPVRVLGATVLILGLAQFSLALLISQDRVRVIPWIAVAVLIENVLLNLALIPAHSFNGAALSGLLSEATFAAALVFFAIRAVGPISATRIALGPVAGLGAMAAIAVVVGTGLGVLPVAVVAYLVAAAAVELARYGGDPRGLRRAWVAAQAGEPRS